MRFTGELRRILKGDRDKAAALIPRARTLMGVLLAFSRGLPQNAWRVPQADGSVITLRYFFGIYIAEIFVPVVEAGAPVVARYYPLFMLRRPDLSIDQDEILLWDHVRFPDTVEPVTWLSRMARPETYITDEDGNVTATLSPTVAREKCGDVDWTGWNGLSLSWDGHQEPLTDDDLPYSGLNNRYFYNYALAGVNQNPDRFASRLYFNGIGFSTISDFLGGAISTITVDGVQGTYAHYVTYFPGTSSTRAIRIFRRPFDIATGKFTSFPSLRNSFLIGTGSGRHAGPFHFNASGTVAKGIATKKLDGSDNAGSTYIVTFTIDPNTGNVTIEDELAFLEYTDTRNVTHDTSLVDTEYPPATLPTGTTLAGCGSSIVYSLPRRYMYRLRNIWTQTFSLRVEAITAVDWVGDEPVYLRTVHEWTNYRRNNTIGVFGGWASSIYQNTGVQDLEADAEGNTCIFEHIGYTGDSGPNGAFGPGPYYRYTGTPPDAPEDYSEPWTGEYDETEDHTYRLTVEGAYTATLLDISDNVTESLRCGGIRNEVDPDTNSWSVSWSSTGRTVLDTSSQFAYFPHGSRFIGLDLRCNSFVFRRRQLAPIDASAAGEGFDGTIVSYDEGEREGVLYRFAGLDEGSYENRNVHPGGSFFLNSSVGMVSPTYDGYDPSTGSGSYDDTTVTEGVNLSLGNLKRYLCGPSYEPTALASMIFKPGESTPLAILHSYNIEQPDSGDETEVYAGIVSSVAGMNRTQEQLRELFGDGELPYATADLEQDFRPVRFGGFNKPVSPDVPLFIPYP